MTTTPTAVWRTWFPAIVRLPDGRVVPRAKVYATDAGLFVYVTGTGSNAEVTEVFRSSIMLDKTSEPATDYASERRGHVIVTQDGTVTVTKSGGCSCGMRALKSLRPAWAGTERVWGA